MQVQVNTDHNIENHQDLTDRISDVVEGALGHTRDRITRVEVHLSDENSAAKDGDRDKRCVMEARIKGHQPVAVTHQAVTLDQAVEGAADKLRHSLEHTLSRLQEQRGR